MLYTPFFAKKQSDNKGRYFAALLERVKRLSCNVSVVITFPIRWDGKGRKTSIVR